MRLAENALPNAVDCIMQYDSDEGDKKYTPFHVVYVNDLVEGLLSKYIIKRRETKRAHLEKALVSLNDHLCQDVIEHCVKQFCFA